MAIARTVFLALLLALGVAPLAEAQNGKPLFIAADMVRDRGGSGPACVLTSRFMRKEGVAWRIRVQGTVSVTHWGTMWVMTLLVISVVQ